MMTHRPDAEVWIIWGDGSCGYSVAEYDTYMRHNVPIISLVGNDSAWTQIEREQVPMFNDDVACPLSYCAYDQVAKGYGSGRSLHCSGRDSALSVTRVLPLFAFRCSLVLFAATAARAL